MVTSKDFVIFRAGDYPQGKYTESDLDEMVSTFNVADAPHIIVGHSSDYKGKTRIPSFGRIVGGLKRVGNELIAFGAQFSDKLAEWIKEGFYNQRSIELATIDGKKKIVALGMLGACPPAVKGLPAMDEALNDIALEFSEAVLGVEFADGEVKAIEFDAVEETEKIGKNDTKISITQCLMEMNESLMQMIDKDEDDNRIRQEIYEHLDDLFKTLDIHKGFIAKIEQIEEKAEAESKAGEMAEKHKWLKMFSDWFNNKNKDKDKEMDAKKEKELNDKIAELELKVKEFNDMVESQRVKAEEAAKAKAEAEKLAADEALKNEIKSFCDTAVSENRMTPAMRETDEPIMVTLAQKDAEALKSFQQKYSAAIIPVGEVTGFSEAPTKTIDDKLNEYAVSHAAEFSGTEAQIKSQVLSGYLTGKIKL